MTKEQAIRNLVQHCLPLSDVDFTKICDIFSPPRLRLLPFSRRAAGYLNPESAEYKELVKTGLPLPLPSEWHGWLDNFVRSKDKHLLAIEEAAEALLDMGGGFPVVGSIFNSSRTGVWTVSPSLPPGIPARPVEWPFAVFTEAQSLFADWSFSVAETLLGYEHRLPKDSDIPNYEQENGILLDYQRMKQLVLEASRGDYNSIEALRQTVDKLIEDLAPKTDDFTYMLPPAGVQPTFGAGNQPPQVSINVHMGPVTGAGVQVNKMVSNPPKAVAAPAVQAASSPDGTREPAPAPPQQAIPAASFDVFLSHSSKDKAVVRAVAERLRADGLKVWFDEWVIKPGDSIPAKIEEGLEHSRVLVLCMSANAFGSDWAQLEAGTFRFRDPLNKERRFIPLRLDDAPIKGSLAQFLYINWLPADREQEYAKLLEACRLPGKEPAA